MLPNRCLTHCWSVVSCEPLDLFTLDSVPPHMNRATSYFSLSLSSVSFVGLITSVAVFYSFLFLFLFVCLFVLFFCFVFFFVFFLSRSTRLLQQPHAHSLFFREHIFVAFNEFPSLVC